MQFFRFFHSIGQGAFYSERHVVNGKDFNIVYDCGSTTLRSKKLERKIKSTYNKGQDIDLLFISHFHADHINGIEILKNRCNIKTVILPVLDNEARVLTKIKNLFDNKYLNTQIIDDSQSFFGEDTTIITVEEINLDQDSVVVNREDLLNVSEISGSTNIQSGKVLISGLKKHDWYFIPFNYRHVLRKNEFIKALKKEDLILDQIDTLEKITTHRDKIKRAYEDIEGDLNTNSLVLFSGSGDGVPFLKSYQGYSRLLDPDILAGCIYFGDVNLKAPGLIQDLNIRLEEFLEYIGSIQIPHHGSIHNFDSLILGIPRTSYRYLVEIETGCNISELINAIISFGENNTYGHPSDNVILEILKNNCQPYLITEAKNTTVIQYKT